MSEFSIQAKKMGKVGDQLGPHDDPYSSGIPASEIQKYQGIQEVITAISDLQDEHNIYSKEKRLERGQSPNRRMEPNSSPNTQRTIQPNNFELNFDMEIERIENYMRETDEFLKNGQI